MGCGASKAELPPTSQDPVPEAATAKKPPGCDKVAPAAVVDKVADKEVAKTAAVEKGAKELTEEVTLDIATENADLFVDHDAVFDQLDTVVAGLYPVRMLRGSWLMKRAEELKKATTDDERLALALPRRQVLEVTHPEAFISTEEIRNLPRGNAEGGSPIPAGAVSHAWLTPEHPDPKGEQLLKVADVIKRAQKVDLPQQRGDSDMRFPSEFGLFYDWCSLFQKDENGERTREETACFRTALQRMQFWYVHQRLFAVIISQLPEGATATPYLDRGWPTVEMAWTRLAKVVSMMTWPPILDAGTASGMIEPAAPLHPDALALLLESKKFTNKKGDLPFVSTLYRKTAESVMGAATLLKYACMDWKCEQLVQLTDLLPLAPKVEQLWFGANLLGSNGCAALCKGLQQGLCPELKVLNFYNNKVGAEGLEALADLLEDKSKLTKLTKVDVERNDAAPSSRLKIAAKNRTPVVSLS